MEPAPQEERENYRNVSGAWTQRRSDTTKHSVFHDRKKTPAFEPRTLDRGIIPLTMNRQVDAKALTHLTQCVGVGRHVGKDDQHVEVALVGQVLGSGECQTRGDDTLDGGVVREVQEKGRTLHRTALLKVVAEETVKSDPRKQQ